MLKLKYVFYLCINLHELDLTDMNGGLNSNQTSSVGACAMTHIVDHSPLLSASVTCANNRSQLIYSFFTDKI